MSEEFSMTPPLTPPAWGQDDYLAMDSDSLDYLDFFNREIDPQPPPPAASSSLTGSGGAVLFNCQGPPRWTEELSRKSYLGTGFLTSLLHHHTPCPTTLPHLATPVFHLPPPTPVNIYLNLHQYFMALRLSISELERSAQSSFSCSQQAITSFAASTSQYTQIRQDTSTFFIQLVGLIQSMQGGGEVGFLGRVRECVLLTLHYLGPLHHLPPHVTATSSTEGNKCQSAAYHLFHLHLDIRWWSLALLYTLPTPPANTPTPNLVQEPPPPPQGAGGAEGEGRVGLGMGVGVEAEDGGALMQCVSMVTWDLLHILAAPAIKASVSEVEELLSWPCGCSLELAVSLLHLLDHRSTYRASQSFWEKVKNKIMVLLKIHMDSSPHTTSTCPLQPSTASLSLPIICPSDAMRSVGLTHIWWIYYTCARLYLYDQTGRVRTDKKEIKGEPKLLRTLVKLTFADPRVVTGDNKPSEAVLRSALRCCVGLCLLWGVGSASWEWVGPLWEHFSRRLSDSFVLAGVTMDILTSHSRTVRGWLEEIQGSKLGATTPKHTSWQLFLTLLVHAIEDGGGRGAGVGWRQVRGRVYSRFHGRLMAELTATGLTHATSLFLTLATAADTLDVSNKLCELLSLVGEQRSSSRTRVVWRSFLATALVLLGTGADLQHLASKFTPMVTAAASQYAMARDPATRRELGQLLVLYAEGVMEVFESSVSLSHSQHLLLCGAMAGVLPQAGIHEVKAVLGMIHAALTKVLSLIAPTHVPHGGGVSEVVGVVWKEFVPFLRSHSHTLTPPRTLGELSACLTLCLACLAPLMSSSHSLPKDAAQMLLLHFLTNEAVNPLCRIHYLAWLLDNLKPDDPPWPGLEGQVVSAWMCTLVTLGALDEIREVSAYLIALPGVAQFLPHPAPPCPYTLARSLMKAVGKKLSSSQSFGERTNLREQVVPYFAGLDRAGGRLLKKTPAPSHLPKAISLLADLFLYAHNAIYIQSNPACLLPGLMSGVFLPSVVYCTDKPLPPPLAAALAPAIPKVIRGLGSLGVSQDAYLQRCIRDAFIHYLPHYPPTSTTPVHPILACVEGGGYVDDDGNDAGLDVVKQLRLMFLEVVRDPFLTKRATPAAHITMALSVVNEGMDRGGDAWVEVCCVVLLLPLLELLLTIEDLTTKKCATHLLKQLLTHAQCTEGLPREVLAGALRQLVSRHLSWSSGPVFRVLRVVGVMHRALVLDALPHITQAVATTEEKRGTGLDTTLRQGYQLLLSSLGVSEDNVQSVE